MRSMTRASAVRTVCSALLVSATALSVVPGAAAQSGESELAGVELIRYGGADRYATSLLVAEALAADAGDSLDWAVMVSGRSWHEAVAAASVAGSLEAPVLMTPPDQVRDDALEFLDRVGVSKVLLVSTDSEWTRSIDAAVDEQLRDAGLTVERIGGSDQFLTSVSVAERLGDVGTLGDRGSTAIIASGEVFADALVAGPLAARGAHPVLLTPQDRLHSAVAGYLQDAGISSVVLMGGTAALSGAVETSISEMGIAVNRTAGATRFETAILTGEFAAQHSSDGCFSSGRVGLARARVPFDSFSAAPLMARQCAPLVLTDPKKIPESTAAYLDGVRGSVDSGVVSVTVFGGDAAVSQAAIDAYVMRDGAPEPEASETATQRCGGSSADRPQQVVGGRTSIAREPDWSPDCKQIAFSSGGSVVVADRDGSNARVVFGEPGSSAVEPTWSPDGSKIAFVLWTDERSQGRRFDRRHIFTVGADGTGAKQLTTGAVEDSMPTWSPDGRKLVFSRQTWSEESAEGRRGIEWFIATVDANGRNLREITRGPFSETHPSWSPDGSRIALEWNGQLAVMDPDGTDIEPLPIDHELNSWSKLSWSPDGDQLAFSIFEERGGRSVVGESNIAVFDFDTKQVTEITDLKGDEINPDWSPDGQLILFNTFEMGYRYSRIFVTGAGGA